MSEVPYVYSLCRLKYWTPFQAVYSSYFYVHLTAGGILPQDHRQLLLRMYYQPDWLEGFNMKKYGDILGH